MRRGLHAKWAKRSTTHDTHSSLHVSLHKHTRNVAACSDCVFVAILRHMNATYTHDSTTKRKQRRVAATRAFCHQSRFTFITVESRKPCARFVCVRVHLHLYVIVREVVCVRMLNIMV
jgi:hypothetical protein